MNIKQSITRGLTSLLLAGALRATTNTALAENNANMQYELNVISAPSSKFTLGRKAPINRIIIHSTEGAGESTLRWLTKDPRCQASAHYMIVENGKTYQMVNDKDTAWQAGKMANSSSLGIEVAGYANKPGFKFTDVQYTNTAKLALNLSKKYNIPKDNIVTHDWVRRNLGGTLHTDPEPNFDWKRFNMILNELNSERNTKLANSSRTNLYANSTKRTAKIN
ncbi:MAG: peptidoglycan recognition family protein [Nanoarchaeota archaeon]